MKINVALFLKEVFISGLEEIGAKCAWPINVFLSFHNHRVIKFYTNTSNSWLEQCYRLQIKPINQVRHEYRSSGIRGKNHRHFSLATRSKASCTDTIIHSMLKTPPDLYVNLLSFFLTQLYCNVYIHFYGKQLLHSIKGETGPIYV